MGDGTTWNEIRFNENDTPQQKADNFDNQLRENGGDPSVTFQSTTPPPLNKAKD